MTAHFLVNLVLIITILCGAVIAWKIAKNVDDSFKSNHGTRVSIKIDRNGKYHYDQNPESDNTDLLFWMRLAILLVAVVLIAIPLQALIDRS
jgi:hypothetical protein